MAKKNTTADVYNVSDNLRVASLLAKVFLATATAVAVLGVVIALSQDTERNRQRFFVTEDGVSVLGVIRKDLSFETVERAYQPATTQGTALSSQTEE